MISPRPLAPLLLIAALVGCGPPETPERQAPPAPIPGAGPRLRLLGTAQDGGLPHAACSCVRCEAARVDPARRRHVASAALILPGHDGGDAVWLIDASPDIRAQLDALRDLRVPPGRVDRSPVDGVLLTHAHLGHYTGLAFFGFEAVHTSGLAVVATPAMSDFLRGNAPWSQLVELGNIALESLEPLPSLDALPTRAQSARTSPYEVWVDRDPVAELRPHVRWLDASVRVMALRVPHRDEFADTVAWIVDGDRRRLLYLPDTEPWDRWPDAVETLLQTVDVALIDGTFFSLDELPGRDVSRIGHPLIVDSIERLAPLREPRRELVFTHFNHSNAVLDGDGTARVRVEAAGFRVADDGDEWPL